MKISDIKIYTLDAFRTNWAFIKVETDEGLYGWGEATLGTQEMALEGCVADYKRLIVGRNPLEVEKMLFETYRDSYWKGGPVMMSALAGIEIACWDIAGKYYNVPTHALLGGKMRDKVKMYANAWFVGAREPADFAAAAKKVKALGIKALKWDPFGKAHMTLSRGEMDHAVAVVGAVREAVGPEMEILIECHGRFNHYTAVAASKELAPFKPMFMEEPVVPDNNDSLAWVRDHSAVPIAAGERFYGLYVWNDVLRRNCVDIAQPDIFHNMGLLTSKKVAAMCEANHVPVSFHNPSGPISNAAILQLAATTPNFLIHEMMLTDGSFRKLVTNENVKFEDGYLVISDKPGLGIDVNVEEIKKRPYTPRNLRHYTGTLTDIRPKGDAFCYFDGLDCEHPFYAKIRRKERTTSMKERTTSMTGTMKTTSHICRLGMAALAVLAIAFVAFGEPTCGVDEAGVYYVNVPRNETATLQTDWANAAIANGGAFAKRGEGTLEAGDPMASFTGEIRVEGGVYKVTTDKGLGTDAGLTAVSNNATLWIACWGFTDRDGSSYGSHRNELFLLSGNGYNGQGALKTSTGVRLVRLLGDTLLAGSALTSRNKGYLNMQGYTMTIQMDRRDQLVLFCSGSIYNAGDIVIERGMVQFQSLSGISGDATCTMTVKKDGVWDNWNTNLKMPWRLVLEDGASIRAVGGALETRSVWSGPISIAGTTSIIRREDQSGGWFLGPTFEGVLSGDGTFDVKRGQYLVLTNGANTFTGSVSLDGVNAWTNSSLRLYNNALASARGDVTLNYGKVELKNSTWWGLHATNRFDLPRLVCTSQGSVVADKTVVGSAAHMERVVSLSKSGAGELTLTGPICVTGRTEVTGGTVRFGSQVPARQTGLNCYYKWANGVFGEITTADSTGGYPCLGVDPDGPSFAYHAWPHHYMAAVYTGHLWIDGDTPVTWRFAGNITRTLWLRIDGQDVIHNRDCYVWPGMSRFTASQPITLQPGHHTVYIYMANLSSSGGQGPGAFDPTTNADIKKNPELVERYKDCYWQSNFGLAYQPDPPQDAPVSSNSNDYVAFTASQFSPSLDGKEQLPGEFYRPSFAGGARFAAGTTLDIGDALPYTPFVVEDFSGAPTVTNGTLSVTGSWALEAADVAGGGLVLGGDANIVFGEGSVLTVADVDSLPSAVRRISGMPIVTRTGTGTITGLPTLTGLPGKWKICMSEDGQSLNIHDMSGLIIILR